MEFLKEVFGDDLYEKAKAALDAYNGAEVNKEKQIKLGNLASGEYVNKLKLEDAMNQLTGKQSELDAANRLIEDLKKGTKGDKVLQGKVTAYETQVTQLQAQLKQTQLDSAIKVALLGAKATDVDYMTFKLKEKGELELDDKGNIVDESEAAYYEVTFALAENNLPTVMKGEINVVTLDFADCILSLNNLPEEFGYYYDNLTLADCKQYITEFSMNKGEMTIGELTVDFSVGDVYGARYNEDGELVYNMPLAGDYTPPPEEQPDTEAAARINELYQTLPKDMDSYIGNNTLIAQLQEFVDLWTATSPKTKTYIERTYGITVDDYMPLYYIYDDLIAFGYLDPSSSSNSSNPSNGLEEMSWEMYMTLALSGMALLTVVCAGAVVVVYRRKRERE